MKPTDLCRHIIAASPAACQGAGQTYTVRRTPKLDEVSDEEWQTVEKVN